MGGSGSGRLYRWGEKDTTNSYLSLDVRRLARDGFLTPGKEFGWRWTRDGAPAGNIRIASEPGQIRLKYRTRRDGGDWEAMDYPVRLLSQQCHFGGNRKWFACPVLGCGRRVAILYGGSVFACRTCHALAYPSQREAEFQRYQRRASKIKARLGWDTSPLSDWGDKPKGMHHRTYARLLSELDAWDTASDTSFAVYFIERFGNLKR